MEEWDVGVEGAPTFLSDSRRLEIPFGLIAAGSRDHSSTEYICVWPRLRFVPAV